GPLGCYALRPGLVDRARATELLSLQGARMKRPSRVHISIATRSDGMIQDVRVGGQAVIVGEGEIRDGR
ncbi:MAG: hypothetical protein WD690_17430, partial [Vicinamibacterales bacterium]